MKDNSIVENIVELLKSSLIEYGDIDEMKIAQKLVCSRKWRFSNARPLEWSCHKV